MSGNQDQHPSDGDSMDEASDVTVDVNRAGDSSPSNPSQPSDGKHPKSNHSHAPWAPLTIPAYRTFWIAGLISNVGTWMHETGAQWMMTSMDPSPAMVAAVRTCMTIPVFCLALPAGVWADRFNRRKWLIATQLLLLAIASLMSLLAGLQLLTPILLLVLTAAMGVGMILNLPAWQALTPELVPRAMVPSAVSVGSISFNLARSLGPVLAGLIISRFDIWAVFGFNAFSFVAVVAVLLVWKPDLETKRKGAKPEFMSELRKGVFVVSRSTEIRNTLIRLVVFAIPASILWSLLALVATQKLMFEERGFGMCLGLIGAGAVVGAWFMPRLRLAISSEKIILVAQLMYALMCILFGLSTSPVVIMPGLVVVGACWMATMTTLNATAQVYLPRKFRARGMAAFMMSFAFGIATGSAIWGWLAYGTDLSTAFVTAGIILVVGTLWMHPYKIGSLRIEPTF